MRGLGREDRRRSKRGPRFHSLPPCTLSPVLSQLPCWPQSPGHHGSRPTDPLLRSTPPLLFPPRSPQPATTLFIPLSDDLCSICLLPCGPVTAGTLGFVHRCLTQGPAQSKGQQMPWGHHTRKSVHPKARVEDGMPGTLSSPEPVLPTMPTTSWPRIVRLMPLRTMGVLSLYFI